MARLPAVSGREARRAFEKAGWVFDRQRGSHMILTRPGVPVNLSVPDHRALDRGLLRPMWYAAVCLAGEAGLRIGEVKGLRWREDVDLVAGTITVNQQIQKDGHEGDPVPGTPKGRTRRGVPVTSTLDAALRGIGRIRVGYVDGQLDGSPLTGGMVDAAIDRICRRAGLPERRWHVLRHCFGTHAAMFGVNPWTLMNWMGHKRIDETMRYVHVAGAHMRPLPAEIVEAGARASDPEKRIVEMLSARARGKAVAKPQSEETRAG